MPIAPSPDGPRSLTASAWAARGRRHSATVIGGPLARQINQLNRSDRSARVERRRLRSLRPRAARSSRKRPATTLHADRMEPTAGRDAEAWQTHGQRSAGVARHTRSNPASPRSSPSGNGNSAETAATAPGACRGTGPIRGSGWRGARVSDSHIGRQHLRLGAKAATTASAPGSPSRAAASASVAKPSPSHSRSCSSAACAAGRIADLFHAPAGIGQTPCRIPERRFDLGNDFQSPDAGTARRDAARPALRGRRVPPRVARIGRDIAKAGAKIAMVRPIGPDTP